MSRGVLTIWCDVQGLQLPVAILLALKKKGKDDAQNFEEATAEINHNLYCFMLNVIQSGQNS